MKKKKTIITTLGLLLIAIVGTTFAYYTSNTSFENVFNAGKYKVTLTEEFVSPDNWVPGETVPKTVIAKNDGTVPAAVRISYTEQWLQEIDGVETDITSQVSPNPAIINFDNTNDWTSSNGYYYYKYILEPTDTTSSFISGVTLDSNLDSVTCTGEGNERVCEAQNKASGAKYKLTFTIQTIQYDVYKSEWNTNVEITEKPRNAVSIVSGTKGNLQPGDKVEIGETEDFYVLSSDNSENGKTVLLAKYNLLVGVSYYDSDSYEKTPITTDTPGYGLQSVDAVGGYNAFPGVAIVSFSDTNYWSEGNNLKSPYNENDTIYYDSSSYIFRYRSDNTQAYPSVYDENSNLYQYISGENGYVSKLIEMGAPSTTTGRILTEGEVVMYQNVEDNGTSIIYDWHQNYWIDYPCLGMCAYGIKDDDDMGYTDQSCNSDGHYGVRPVIEIPTSALQ